MRAASRISPVVLLVFCTPSLAFACPACWPLVKASVFDGAFVERLVLMLVPFAVTGLLLAAAHRLDWLDWFGGNS